MEMTSQVLCPPIGKQLQMQNSSCLSLHHLASPPQPIDGICANSSWNRNGITVAGGKGQGHKLN
jgi:hypothetical protein